MEGKYNSFGIPKHIVSQTLQNKLYQPNIINIKTDNKLLLILLIAKS